MSNDLITYQEKIQLEHGKYDITYMINLLTIIHEQCEKQKFNRDFAFSMRMSIQRLLGMLIIERDNKNQDHVIMFTCDKCGQSELIFQKDEYAHRCNFCKFKKLALLE